MNKTGKAMSEFWPCQSQMVLIRLSTTLSSSFGIIIRLHRGTRFLFRIGQTGIIIRHLFVSLLVFDKQNLLMPEAKLLLRELIETLDNFRIF